MKMIGKVGELSSTLEAQHMYFHVLDTYPQLMLVEDQLSFPELQKYYAVCCMKEAYNMTMYEYNNEQAEKEAERARRK